jgi:hypothetical protein
VKISEAFANVENISKGIVEEKPFPDYSRVLITVRAKYQKEKMNYSVNGKIIMVGVTINFRTRHFISYGTCIAMEELDETEEAEEAEESQEPQTTQETEEG